MQNLPVLAQCRHVLRSWLPVAMVFENLEDMSIEEVMEEYDVTREQIEAVLEFVAQILKAPIVQQPRPRAGRAHHIAYCIEYGIIGTDGKSA